MPLFIRNFPTGMSNRYRNGSENCVCLVRSEASSSHAQASPENAEAKDNVRVCHCAAKADPGPEDHDPGPDAGREATSCLCSCSPEPKYDLEERVWPEEPHYEKPKWLDCFAKGCQKKECFDEIGIIPIRYPTSEKPCEPEYYKPCKPKVWTRRPPLPPPPEMLSSLKKGIHHSRPVTIRKKEMETRLDKLSDEHRATAFPPGTKPFCDNCYNSTYPASSYIRNYDILRADIGLEAFEECKLRPALMFLNDEKYKFVMEMVPMPQQRLLNIPINRVTRWHNYVVRPLKTLYSESWRQHCKVPDNWFGPPPPVKPC